MKRIVAILLPALLAAGCVRDAFIAQAWALLTNVIFLRTIAIALMFAVTAVYFLRKEPTVKSFVAFIAGDVVGIFILAFSEYLKNAAALPYIVVSIALVILFDVWLIAKAFALNKKGNESGK